MKRIAVLLAALLCISLAACTNAPAEVAQDTSQSGDSFYAQILSIEGDSVLVEALEDEWVLASSTEFTFSAAELPDIGAAPGAYVNLVFTGEIAESFPAQITVLNWFDISDQFDHPQDIPAMTAFYHDISSPISPFPPYAWSHYLEDGTVEAFVADGFGPLDGGAVPLILETESEGDPIAAVLLLSKDMLPDQITAVAWPADILELPAEERLYDSAITLETSGGYIMLPEDGAGYLIFATAVWSDKEDGATPFGSANYLLLVLR